MYSAEGTVRRFIMVESHPVNRKKAFNMLFFLEFWERFGYYGLQAVLASFFVKSLGMEWPQMSDLKGWQCEGAALYGVRAIPATLLVSKDGTIVARDLRGEDLEAKLAELMK